MRILGIDPGLTRVGVGVVDVRRDRSTALVHVGVIRTAPSLELERRILTIAEGVTDALATYAPDVVALERVFAQHNLRTVMGVAQTSGVVLHLAAARGLRVALHTPSEVKAAVTGYGAADKRQVGAMVARILGLDAAPTPADAADALALAICHGWSGDITAPASGGALTPAQRAWRDAEKSAGLRRVVP